MHPPWSLKHKDCLKGFYDYDDQVSWRETLGDKTGDNGDAEYDW